MKSKEQGLQRSAVSSAFFHAYANKRLRDSNNSRFQHNPERLFLTEVGSESHAFLLPIPVQCTSLRCFYLSIRSIIHFKSSFGGDEAQSGSRYSVRPPSNTYDILLELCTPPKRFPFRIPWHRFELCVYCGLFHSDRYCSSSDINSLAL